jgi:sulfur carrier protein ThiS
MTATMNATLTPATTATATGIATIELCGFMFLSDLFKERHWANPQRFEVETEMTGRELLDQLEIPAERVGMMLVNHRVFAPAKAIVRPGDRVALVSPGAPTPF